MKCIHCGNQNSANEKFCKMCGVRVATQNSFTYQSSATASGKRDYRKYIFNRYFGIFVAVIILVSVSSGDDNTIHNSGTASTLPAPIAQVADNSVEIPPSTPAVSLSNGTVLKKSKGYFGGYGKLEITNGTSLDAVAKLIHGGTSILTVYIKANSTYTMSGIIDGTYWLAFAQGTDWNSTTKKFNRNPQYSSFDDTFVFATTEDADYYHYSTFEVTLNPVVGGTAQTSSVNPGQFDAY